MQNKELAKEVLKSIIRKFEKQKVHSFFKDNIWGVNVADMQLISKFNKWFRFNMLLIFAVSMHGLFPWETKKVLLLLTLFNFFWPKVPLNNFTLKNCLFGVINIVKNNGIAFDGKGE